MQAQSPEIENAASTPNIKNAIGDVLNKTVETHSSEAVAGVVQQGVVADIARLIESVPSNKRLEIWTLADVQTRGALLAALHRKALIQLAKEVPNESLYEALESLATDDMAAVVDVIPNDMSAYVLSRLGEKRRNRVERVLSYGEQSAMRLLDHDVVEVRRSMTVATVLAHIRELGGLPHATDRLMVVDENRKYFGTVDVGRMLGQQDSTKIVKLLDVNHPVISVHDDRVGVAQLFEDRDLISAAVLNEKGELQGRITVDDVVHVIHGQAEKPVMQMAGLDTESDLFAPVMKSAKSRAFWLGINLVTAFLAAAVIGLFTEVLEKIVALAVLMPVVASMGGIAGSQTLTLTIRGVSLGQINAVNAFILAKNELAIGVINGILWALVIGFCAWLWFDSVGVAFTIAVAIVVNMLAAAISGIVVPLSLQKMGQDPALSGAVVLTTVTDVVGFMTFLGLSSLLLL